MRTKKIVTFHAVNLCLQCDLDVDFSYQKLDTFQRCMKFSDINKTNFIIIFDMNYEI